MSHRILVVDRAKDTRELLVEGLSNWLGLDGYAVIPADSTISGLRAARAEKPGLVVIALGGEDFDGLEMFKRLRRGRSTSGIPVLVLADSDSEDEEVRFLDQGVDDYVPFSTTVRAESIFARCRALLRRHSHEVLMGPKVVRLGPLVADPDANRVLIGRKVYEKLSVKEFEVLCCLARHHPKPINRQQLFREVWPGRRRELPASNASFHEEVAWTSPLKRHQISVSLKTVGVHIAKLRGKLGKRLIRYIRGRGFVLFPPPQSEQAPK